jgi:hypothetical protein
LLAGVGLVDIDALGDPDVGRLDGVLDARHEVEREPNEISGHRVLVDAADGRRARDGDGRCRVLRVRAFGVRTGDEILVDVTVVDVRVRRNRIDAGQSRDDIEDLEVALIYIVLGRRVGNGDRERDLFSEGICVTVDKFLLDFDIVGRLGRSRTSLADNKSHCCDGNKRCEQQARTP